MSEAWFRPKSHGFGATPTGWKGWAFIAAFGVAQTVFACAMLWPGAGWAIDPVRIAIWGTLSAVATVLFLRVCRNRTNGEWRWRWGSGK